MGGDRAGKSDQLDGESKVRFSNSPYSDQASSDSRKPGTIGDEDARGFVSAFWRHLKQEAIDIPAGAVIDAKRAAAYHEAGHVVVAATNGIIAEKVHIWPVEMPERVDWFGHTALGNEWINRATARYLRQAQITLAGLMAEWIYVSPYIEIEFCEELAVAVGAALIAAHEVGRDLKALWPEVIAETKSVLKAHAPIVHAVAHRLMRKRRVNAVMLRKLLAPVLEHAA